LRKRKNKTIIEAINAIMRNQNPCMILWVEAYVQNKSLHQTLKNITPEEVFTRIKPDIEHFR
jgi:hypothetical protein